MTIDTAVQLLEPYGPLLLGRKTSAILHNITDVSSLVGNGHLNTLYIGTLSEAINADIFQRCVDLCFLLLRDSGDRYPDSFLDRCFVMELPGTANLDACIQKLTFAMGADDAALSTNSFLAMLLQPQSLFGVVDAAARYFGLPLVVGSPGGRKVYTISQSVEGHGIVWEALKKTGEFSVEQHCVDMELNYGKDYTNNLPYYVYYPAEDQWRIMSKIYSGSEYLGTLHSFNVPYEQIAKIGANQFQLLSNVVAHYITVGTSIRIDKIGRSDFRAMMLGDILDGAYPFKEPPGNAPVNQILECQVMRLVNFPLKEYDYKNNFDGFLIRELNRFFSNSVSFYYRRNVIMLMNVDKDENCFVNSRVDFEKMLIDKHVFAVISDDFKKISDVLFHYQQTERVIAIAERLKIQKPVLEYQDFKIYDMALASVSKRNIKALEQYCSPLLLKIREFDTSNDRELYSTLREYILTNKSLSNTAQNMFLHKSTVAYRIRRIKELFNIELENIQQVFQLYHSFIILDLISTEPQDQDKQSLD